MAPKNPLRKWVGRRYSPERLERAKTGREETRFLHLEGHRLIFSAAEEILRKASDERACLVFAGMSMRPIFEAVRAINEVRRKIPRKRIVYVVTPERKITREKIIIRNQGNLKERLALKPGIRTARRIIIVDYRWSGRTINALSKAVRKINPLAEVTHFTQENHDGIHHAEGITKPTNKDSTGRVSPGNEQERRSYLSFQIALQKYIDLIKKEGQYTN